MAAKVVMVAVPTVIGIASIRVYTVREQPTDGLVTREKLNIYTPLPQSAQAQFVPERPGVIQSGLTTARHTVLPFVLAVKGACVSVKTTSVNLYYAGEDVYYYLKDPPPGFLPRFGTITMAGLLGMFLARKGSQFRRLAVPLGLMSAGASVCYPAQTVAALKVTGKKVYAAGQWSSSTVSSLLASRSQEVATEERAASQPQTAAGPDPESVVSEETSLAPETEPGVIIKDEQTPTETSTDPGEHSVPAETEAPPSEETQQSLEPERVEAAPVEVEAAPVEVEAAQVEAAPVEVEAALAEVEAAPAEVEAAPAEVEAAPAEVEAAPAEVEAAPVEVEAAPAEVEAAPAEVEAAPAEVEAAPAEVEAAPAEVEAAPAEVEAAPVEVEAAQVEAAPVEVEAAQVEAAPVEVEVAQVEAAPAESPEASPEPAAEPEADPEADPQQDAAVQETLTPPPPPQQPEAANSKGGSGFKADPALMDFGQSSPEDEDLYSTRS